jgi:glycosyltransferase involved in cell wall biosynthesis
MARLTVLMSIHNGSSYLDQAIQSLISQTHTDFELIVVDDGSTDDSASIIEANHKNLEIRVFTNSRKLGITKSLKIGISNARTSRVVIFDQDDICLPGRLKAFTFGFDSGAKLIMSSYRLIDDKSNFIGKTIEPPDFLCDSNYFSELIKRNYFLGSAMGFDLSAFDLSRIRDDSGMATDYAFALEMAKRRQPICLIRQTLLCYRIHPKNTSGDYKARDTDARKVLKKVLYEEVANIEMEGMRFERLLALMIGYQFIGDFRLSGELFRILHRKYPIDDSIPKRLKCEYMFYTACQQFFEDRYSDALKFLELLEIELPQNPIIINNRGCVFMRTGKTSDAINEFQVALAISPNYRDARENLAAILGSTDKTFFTGRYPRAVLI